MKRWIIHVTLVHDEAGEQRRTASVREFTEEQARRSMIDLEMAIGDAAVFASRDVRKSVERDS